MGEFQGEQAQISAVEQKASKLDDKGKKTHEQLEAELKAKHDVFFKQVTDTEKVFKEAEKIKDPDSVKSITADKTEIKNKLVEAANSGEQILKDKTQNPDFVTIRQSADRITKLTSTVGENLKFFQNMDLANEALGYAKDNMKKAKAYEPEPGMAMREFGEGWQKEYKACMENGIGNSNAVSAILSNYSTQSSPELKAVYDRIKKENDDTAYQLVESRMRFFKNFGDKNNTYFDDDGKEHEMSQEQKDAVNKLQGIREGKKDSKGELQGSYIRMMLMSSSGKYQLEQAKTATDEKSKRESIDTAKDCYTQEKGDAEGVSKDLASLDPKLLPGTFAEIYNLMNNSTAASLKEATTQLEQLEKGAPLDSKAAMEAAEKEYSEGENSPKKSYENAIAARDKMMEGTEIKLDDKNLQEATEAGLTGLCALRGKLAAFDRSTIPREDQPRFDTFISTLDSNIKELAQIKILMLNKVVIDTLDKDGKYLKIEKKEVNGMTVVVITQTPEFLKLNPDQQKLIMSQFEAVQAQISLDITRKMDLKEDKDWNDGMAQMETGNWQGAKKLLLQYYNKNNGNPEKALQIGAATGVLKKIVEMEFQQAKENLQILDGLNKSNDDGGLKSINHDELWISLTQAWKKMDAAERELGSGKYLTIEDVWDKVGPPNAKDVVEGTPLGGTDLGLTTVGEKTFDKISFLNPKVISGLVSEPDPVKRRNNILMIARAAQAAGMTPFAKKYFEMYFAGEIVAKKKVITRDQVEQSFNSNPEHEQQIKDGIQAAHEQARTKFITEDNRQHPFVAFDNANIERQNKILDKWEEDYKANSGNIEDQVRNGIIDDLWTKEAKKAINKDWENAKSTYAPDPEYPELTGELVPSAPVNIWHEAYGGGPDKIIPVNFGVAENITGATLTFTSDDIRNTCARIAVSILYLEIAAAAAAIGAAAVGGLVLGGGIVATGTADAASLAALAESGMAVGSTQAFAAGAASFATEGLIMHTVSVGLNEGAEGLEFWKDPKKFFKGLATTYATLGIMKGVSTGLGAIGSKAGEAMPTFARMAEGMPGVIKTGVSLTGKSLVDSAVMTGISYGTERLFNGHAMTSEELKHAFGENFVTFMAMGGVHATVESAHEGGPKPLSKEQKDLLDTSIKANDAEAAAKDARAKYEKAKAEGKLNEWELAQLDVKADALEANAKKANTEAARKLEAAQKAEREARVAEMQKKIDALKKELERKDLPAEERKQMQSLVEQFERAKINGADIEKAYRDLLEEHRKVEIPDPNDPTKTIEVDLFDGVNSKNFAYTKEMVELMNNYDKLAKEGPKIIKHGGDEILILHAGPGGKVEMFFGDVGNMGPTNEFALRLKGGDANMVDLYLADFAQIVKARFKPGQAVDGPAVLGEIKNTLSKKYFGIETEADFIKLQKQYGIDGDWAQYQQNMGNARVLAGFRAEARGLQKEFADSVGDRPADPARDNKEFADFVAKKIKGLDTGTPPLTEVLKANLDALEKGKALDDLFPKGKEFEGASGRMSKAKLEEILNKPEDARNAEENLAIFYALKRVNSDKIGTLAGMDAAGSDAVSKRFGAIRQPADAATLMDFQMAGIDIPKFEGRQFNTTDMKFLLDKVLEDGLHSAKKAKGTVDIYHTESPFDSNGEIRADLPNAEKLRAAYEKAGQDKKAETIGSTQKLIVEARQKLDAINKKIQEIMDKQPLTKEDMQALAELQKDYDAVVKKLNNERYKDADTGADKPGKFAQDIDFWMRDREGNPINAKNQIYREFVIDMNNTGAINAQEGGYAITDKAMAEIASSLMKKFPGASSIIRTGGGGFKLVYLDAGALPQVDGKPVEMVKHQAMVQAALPEINAEVQRIIKANTATVIDGNVRDATAMFRTRGGKPVPVGEVQLLTGLDIGTQEFADLAAKVKTPKTLFEITKGKKGVEVPAAPKVPTVLSELAVKAAEAMKPAEISPADREIIDHKPDGQPQNPDLEATIKDNNKLEADYKEISGRLKKMEDQALLNQMKGITDPDLATQIEALKTERTNYEDSLKFEREIEQEARTDFVQKHIEDAAKLHPDIPLPQLHELMMRSPLDYEQVIYLSKQSAKLEGMGLHQAAKDMANLTADFASVDGSPLKTAEQRSAFLEKMLKLSPIEREWYTTRPETTLDTSDPDYQQKFNDLKDFNAKFMSEKVLPLLIAKNLPVDQLILEIHKWQARGSQAQMEVLASPAEGYDISGKVRDVTVSVGEYVAPVPGRVPELLGKMSSKMQGIEGDLAILKQSDPAAYEKAVVKTALYALQTFVEIHPMRDGNGRTGRALYEYYIVKFLGPESRYRKLPMETRDDGESSLHGDLHGMNDKLSKTLYEGKPLGRLEGLFGNQLAQKIDTTDLARITSDPLYEEFFANYNRLMASSP